VKTWLAPLIKLSLFLVVTTSAAYVLGATISNQSYGSTYSYSAEFSDVAGLNLDDDVRIAGVRVGSVEGIKVVRRNLAQVSFSVQTDRRLPKSVLAQLRYRNLVGQRYLQLSQGPGDADDLLQPGGLIPQKQTTNALDLTQLFGGFQPLFQVLNPAELNELSQSLIDAFQGDGPAVQLLTQQIADLSNALASKDQAVGNIINNFNTVLGAVTARDAEFTKLIDSVQQWVSGLAQDRAAIGSAIDGVNGLTTAASQLLGGIRAPLKTDIQQLQGLATQLNKDSGTLQTVLTKVPGRAAALVRVTSYGSWMNLYVCNITGTYIDLGNNSQPVNYKNPAARCG